MHTGIVSKFKEKSHLVALCIMSTNRTPLEDDGRITTTSVSSHTCTACVKACQEKVWEFHKGKV